MDEREPEHETLPEFLEDWREAERAAATEEPDSGARKMARKRADAARDDFHDAEDDEHHRFGDDSPRKTDNTT